MCSCLAHFSEKGRPLVDSSERWCYLYGFLDQKPWCGNLFFFFFSHFIWGRWPKYSKENWNPKCCLTTGIMLGQTRENLPQTKYTIHLNDGPLWTSMMPRISTLLVELAAVLTVYSFFCLKSRNRSMFLIIAEKLSILFRINPIYKDLLIWKVELLKKGRRRRGKDRVWAFLSAGSLTRWMQQLKRGQAEDRCQELCLCVPWQNRQEDLNCLCNSSNALFTLERHLQPKKNVFLKLINNSAIWNFYKTYLLWAMF